MPNLQKLKETLIKQELEKNYPFQVRSLKRLSGFYDANYKINTDRGYYFVKIYGLDKLPAITFQIDLIDRLAAKKIPVGVIQRTKTGQEQFKIANTYGIVQQFLPGQPIKDSQVNEKLYRELGQLLGRFHNATNHANFRGQKWKKYLWDLAQFDLAIADLPKTRRYLTPEQYSLVQGVSGLWKASQSPLQKLRKGVIHNDFHKRNIILSEDKSLGITDFGDSLYSWFAADVAVALMHLCFIYPKRSVSLSRAFLRGYEKTFNLTKTEKEQLHLLIRLRACLLIIELPLHFKGVPKIFYRRFFTGAIFALKYFKDIKNQTEFVSQL